MFLLFPVYATGVQTGIDTVALDSLPPLEKMPELIEFIPAVYPAEALKAGIEGSVLVDIFVTDSGRVDSIKVLKGLSPALDSAAMAAVQRFRYRPAMAGGLPVPVFLQYEYRFSVSDEVRRVEEYVNLMGTLLEMGTRAPVRDGVIAATFPDTASDTAVHVPFTAYLQRIGSFAGQTYEGGGIVTYTDSLGRFSFKSLPVGRVLLKFPIAGYRADSLSDIIEREKQREVEYRLERLNYNEYEIVVYGKMEKKEVAKSTLSLTEVKRVPGFSGDAVKVVQALPGVARASFISGDVIVRGSGNEDTRYFLDGVEIPMLFHFGGLRSTYNSDALSAVDLYPGGFNARYGGCVGGVVEIKGRPAKTDRWHGNVDINLIDASFVAEGPVKPGVSLMVSARRSYIATVAKFVIDQAGIYLPMTVVPYYWDAVARLDYVRSNNCKMFLTLFTSQDRMEFIVKQVRGGSTEVSAARNLLSEDINFQQAIFGLDQKLSEHVSHSLRASASRQIIDFNVFSFVRTQQEYLGPYIRDQVALTLSPRLTLFPGVDLQARKINYDLHILSAQGAKQSGRDIWFTDLGAYANAEYRPWKTLTLTPGLRYDYYAEVSEGLPSLRLTTRWEWAPGRTLKGAAGTYNQTPKPMGQAIDSVWGNPDLPLTTGRQVVLGHEWQLNDLISLDVQGYYNTQDNIPANTDSVNPATGQPLNFLPDQEGRMFGMEIMLRHDPGEHFFGWISYTLSRSERRTPNPPGNAQGAEGIQKNWDPNAWYKYEKDQTHNLQIIGSWRLAHGIEPGFRLRYVTGNPETPRLGYTEKKYEFNADDGRYTTLEGQYFSDRMGPFFQLDARIDKKWVFQNWLLSAYLDVQNTNYFLYNSPEAYDYGYDDSERQVIGGIIIPSLGVRAEF
ncbi:MAG: TonB-dependent receptor [Fibrobacterota bacterium]